MKTTEDKDALLGKVLVQALQEECGVHPEVEDLAALIDGKLSPDERAGIMGHVASCDTCYELFSMSSEMAKERQKVGRIARFKIPFALAAGFLIVVGAFFAYNSLRIPSEYIVALKVAPQKEAAPRLSAPAESKGEKKMEVARPHENHREEKPASAFYAKMAVNDAVEEFLRDIPDDLVTDKEKIGELVAMLSKDDRNIGRYNISEVRIEWGETLMRSVRRSADKAEITIKNGVLTMKLVNQAGVHDDR